MIHIIKNLITLLLISFLLGACSSSDKKEPISLDKIDWEYLSENGKDWSIEYVRVYTPSNEFYIQTYIKKFCKLMLDNSDKIYAKESDSTVKIYLRFNKISAINMLYTRDEYNGKESTFYVDESLLRNLENIQNENGKNLIEPE